MRKYTVQLEATNYVNVLAKDENDAMFKALAETTDNKFYPKWLATDVWEPNKE